MENVSRFPGGSPRVWEGCGPGGSPSKGRCLLTRRAGNRFAQRNPAGNPAAFPCPCTTPVGGPRSRYLTACHRGGLLVGAILPGREPALQLQPTPVLFIRSYIGNNRYMLTLNLPSGRRGLLQLQPHYNPPGVADHGRRMSFPHSGGFELQPTHNPRRFQKSSRAWLFVEITRSAAPPDPFPDTTPLRSLKPRRGCISRHRPGSHRGSGAWLTGPPGCP